MDERVEKKVTPPRITGSCIVNVIQRVKIQLDDSTVYILHHHDKVQPQVHLQLCDPFSKREDGVLKVENQQHHNSKSNFSHVVTGSNLSSESCIAKTPH